MSNKKPESHWNYRVMRRVINGETFYGIHEVYYRCGKVSNWTQEAVKLDYLDNPHEVLEKILRGAKEFPALDYNTGKELPHDDSE